MTMLSSAVDGARLLADLNRLREVGRNGTGVTRRALSPQDIAARRLLAEWLTAAGLEAEIDGVGTVVGRTPGATRHVLIGSHTDTVPSGGWLDGALGVMTALEIARAWQGCKASSPVGVGVISFIDEEGRFGPLVGSRLFAGKLVLDAALDGADEGGLSFRAALAASGLAERPLQRLDPRRDAAYLEVHIEQGPVLEHEGLQIGLVTGIVGIGRSRVVFHGRADHAGTTPMAMRADAAAAAYAFGQEFYRHCAAQFGETARWNVVVSAMAPGAFNVVTERAELIVEYRSQSSAVLDAIDRLIPEIAGSAAAPSRVRAETAIVGRVDSAALDPGLLELTEQATKQAGRSWRRMVSGAGHDAMTLAPLVPTAMLFIPSIGGRSHTPEEDSKPEDIAAGLDVAARTVEAIISRIEHGGL